MPPALSGPGADGCCWNEGAGCCGGRSITPTPAITTARPAFFLCALTPLLGTACLFIPWMGMGGLWCGGVKVRFGISAIPNTCQDTLQLAELQGGPTDEQDLSLVPRNP